VEGAVDAEVEDDDDDDDVEGIDDTEFVRDAPLRGIKIRVTSSALIESSPSLSSPVFHRGKGWKLGGEITAVIGMMNGLVDSRICVVVLRSLQLLS